MNLSLKKGKIMKLKSLLLGTVSLLAVNSAIAQNDSKILPGFDILAGPTFRLPTESSLYRERPIQLTAEIGKSLLFNSNYEPTIYLAAGIDLPVLGNSTHIAFDKYDRVEFKDEIGDKKFAAYAKMDVNIAHCSAFPGENGTIGIGIKQYFAKASEVNGLKGITAATLTGTQTCGENGFIRVELGYEFAAAAKREIPNPGQAGQEFKKVYGPYMALNFGYRF